MFTQFDLAAMDAHDWDRLCDWAADEGLDPQLDETQQAYADYVVARQEDAIERAMDEGRWGV